MQPVVAAKSLALKARKADLVRRRQTQCVRENFITRLVDAVESCGFDLVHRLCNESRAFHRQLTEQRLTLRLVDGLQGACP